jgi:ubiquinone/menaquinone biosynthesis C-methylase UbiE
LDLLGIGEWLAWKLNQLFPTLSIHEELREAKSSTQANQRWAYEDAQHVSHQFGPLWDLAGRKVLNVGHGLGGKLPFYIEEGARSVVGIDINGQSTHIAQRHIRSLGLADGAEGGVFLAVADASHLPFRDGCFDTMVSINTFEHIIRLEEALADCYRVLAPGGRALLYLPPYYSPWGPHLENWIHFPWPHLIFSDQTLLRVAAREDAKLQLNREFVAAAQIDWTEETERIPDVNRVTLRQFRRMIARAGFSVVEFRLLPFGYDALRSGPPPRLLALSLLNVLTRVPVLQEIVVTKIACVLEKEAQR